MFIQNRALVAALAAFLVIIPAIGQASELSPEAKRGLGWAAVGLLTGATVGAYKNQKRLNDVPSGFGGPSLVDIAKAEKRNDPTMLKEISRGALYFGLAGALLSPNDAKKHSFLASSCIGGIAGFVIGALVGCIRYVTKSNGGTDTIRREMVRGAKYSLVSCGAVALYHQKYTK